MLTTIARERLARLRASQASTDAPTSLLDFVPEISPELQRPVWLGPYAAELEQACPADGCPGGRRVVVAAPPQHGKTELTLRAFLYWDRKYPGKRHVYASYNAERVLEVARTFETIADRAGLTLGGTLAAMKLPNGSMVKFTSVGGSLTGYPVDGVCIVDDPIKGPVEAASPTYRKMRVEWFDTVAFTRRHPGTSFIVMATRWHPEDLSGALIKRGWPYVNLKALAEGETVDNVVISDPLRRAPGEALWPSHKPPEFFEEERADAYKWASLFQGEPRPRGGQVFREPGYYTALPEHSYRVAYGVDLAYTAKTHADHSVMLELWRTDDDPKRPKFYVVAVHRAQVDAPSFTLTLKARNQRVAPMRWYASGTEKGAADFIKRQGIPLEVLPPKGDKFTRAQGVAAAWNDGRVLVPDTDAINAPWLPVFLDEVLNFTGIADLHDDQVDALAAAFDRLNVSTGARLIKVGNADRI